MTHTSEIGILRAARGPTAMDAGRTGSRKRERLPRNGSALFLPAILLWLAAMPAAAQQDAAAVTAPPSDPGAAVRYTIEVIVFTYADSSSAGNEVFAPPAPLPAGPFDDLPRTGAEEGPVFDDRMPQAGSTGTTEGEPPGEIPARARIELQKLAPEAFRMQDAWRKLRQLDAYRPILHAAWTQTTHEKAVSPALPLRALSDPPLGLDGSISLYRSRFLHLDIDLTLDASAFAGESRRTATDRLVNPASPGDAMPDDGPVGLALPPVRYRITEDRIMRDGDVRYFDHPRFGMLARVTRVEPEENSSAAD